MALHSNTHSDTFALRGATTATGNTSEAITEAVSELMRRILAVNTLEVRDIVSVWFTMTEDLTSANPAHIVRVHLGDSEPAWQNVAMLCAVEPPIEGSLPYCVRLLMHYRSTSEHSPQHAPQHVYLNEAATLRPDWA